MQNEINKYIILVKKEPWLFVAILAIGIMTGAILPFPTVGNNKVCASDQNDIVKPIDGGATRADGIDNFGERGEAEDNQGGSDSSIRKNTDELSVSQKEDICCVDIAGAVKSPGVYCIESDSILNHLIDIADGYLTNEYAKKYVEQNLNLASSLKDGDKIYIPYINESTCELSIEKSAVFAGGKEFKESSNGGFVDVESPQGNTNGETDGLGQDDGACVDLNTATLEELDALEGIGASTAQKIIDARPYTSVEELLDVSGIGETKLSAIEDLVCVK